jgi:MFS family permease
MATIPAPALSATADDPRPLVSALPPLLALALATALGFMMMGSFSTVQEGAKAEMALSDYSLSLVQGLSAAIPLVFLSIPIGIAVDRMNRIRLLIGMALVWTAGTLLTAFAQSFLVLFVARMMTSIGMSGALTAALSLAADFSQPSYRGRAALIVTLGKTLGQAAGFALAGAMFGLFVAGGALASFDELAPWRSAHVMLAIVGAVLMLPLFLLREPARREVAAGPNAPFKVVAGELWARRAFLGPLFAGQVCIVMADAAAGIWAAPVLSRNYGLQPTEFAGWMGLLMLGAGIVGALLGGFAADLGHRSGRRGGILIGAVVAAAIGIPAALFPVSPDVPWFAVALGLLVLSGTVTGLVMSVALTVLLPNELRGLCIGAFIAIAGLIGFGVSPTLVALASDLLGGEQHLGEGLALVGVAVSVVGLLGFWAAMRHAPRSVREEAV